MRTIPISVLTNVLSRVYELYLKYEKDEYVEDVFGRAELEIITAQSVFAALGNNGHNKDFNRKNNNNNNNKGLVGKTFDMLNPFAPSQKEIAMPPDYYELIIESGFNAYFLVNMFLENKKKADKDKSVMLRSSVIDDEEMNEYINEFAREENSGNLQSLLKGNIFGELTTLGGALFQAGKSAMKELHTAAAKKIGS